MSEAVDAWQLPPGTALGFVGTSGRVVRREAGVTLFVKRRPPAARVCGGIGTWPQPAAQLGASFFAGGSLVVDPFERPGVVPRGFCQAMTGWYRGRPFSPPRILPWPTIPASV